MPQHEDVKMVQQEKEKNSDPKDTIVDIHKKREGSSPTSEPQAKKGRFKSKVKLLMAVQDFVKRSKKPKLDHVKLAYPGTIGSFAELAAKDYYSECKDVKNIGVPGFDKVFKLVESGEVQYGILPIENSRSGVLSATLDLLVNHNLFIIGETSREEGHYLCALPGVTKKDIKKVYSHPHLLSQCKNFLQTLADENQDVEKICVSSSSAAIATVKADQNKKAAAIASKEAAEHEGLTILAENIADYHPIASRYLIFSKTHAEFTNTRDLKLKSTICVSCKNEQGSLFKVLSCFALRGIDILALHSRPSSTISNQEKQSDQPLRHWDLIFYIDYTPSQDEKTNQSLMVNIREYCDRIQEFGTYEENNTNKQIDHWNICSNAMSDAIYY